MWFSIAASVAPIAALIVSIVALFVSFYAVHRGNRNTSAATLISLMSEFRTLWGEVLKHENKDDESDVEDKFEYDLAEVLNLLEIASAICNEGSLAGKSKEICMDYLRKCLSMISKEEFVKKHIPSLCEEDENFCNIREFIRKTPALASKGIEEIFKPAVCRGLGCLCVVFFLIMAFAA